MPSFERKRLLQRGSESPVPEEELLSLVGERDQEAPPLPRASESKCLPVGDCGEGVRVA